MFCLVYEEWDLDQWGEGALCDYTILSIYPDRQAALKQLRRILSGHYRHTTLGPEHHLKAPEEEVLRVAEGFSGGYKYRILEVPHDLELSWP